MGFPHGTNHSCQGSEVRGQLLIEGRCILPALTPSHCETLEGGDLPGAAFHAFGLQGTTLVVS